MSTPEHVPASLAMAVSLRKGGDPVSLVKPDEITIAMRWPAATDYDLGAEVLYHDGHVESIATFPAIAIPASLVTRRAEGAVRHMGDVARLPGAEMAQETLRVRVVPEIAAIVPWAYSAQSNGTGSFHRYRVEMEVVAGDQVVRITADEASMDNRVYTCVPGMITNLASQGVRLHRLERYSSPGCERRPLVRLRAASLLHRQQVVDVTMDGGPTNMYK